MDSKARRALLVDDEPRVLAQVAALLRGDGWQVEAVRSGRAALAALASGPWALVCLDLTLPDLAGAELLERIRQTPGLQRIPVLALSARALPIHQAEAQERGATAFLPKPFRPEELLERVRALAPPQGASQEERQAL